MIRTAHCACGADYEQESLGPAGRFWVPSLCAACLRVALECEEAAAYRAHAEQLLKRVAIPAKYQDATLENFQLHGPRASRTQQERMLRWAERYLATWPAVPLLVVFQGAYQTGKTHIAWGLIRALANLGVPGRLVTVADLIRDLRESWRSKDGPSEAERLHRYRRHAFLVLDELSGHNLAARHIQPHLYDVVAHRINENRPTILTTNASDREVHALLGGALRTRLMVEGGIVEFGQDPYRRA